MPDGDGYNNKEFFPRLMRTDRNVLQNPLGGLQVQRENSGANSDDTEHTGHNIRSERMSRKAIHFPGIQSVSMYW
jgi:hypothetical protein